MSTCTPNQNPIRRNPSSAATAVLDRAPAPQATSRSSGHYQIVLLPIETRDLQCLSTSRKIATSSTLESTPLFGKLVCIGAESPRNQHCDIAEFGCVRIDFLRHEAWRASQRVALTAFEFRVLRFLVANPCRVVSRDEFLETVWGYNCYPTTRTVDNKILRLRQNLESNPANPVHFLTIHGAGYKFVP